MLNNLLNYFPKNISEILKKYINKDLEEIRIRVNKPIILKNNAFENIVNYTITQQEILEITQKICENSIYAYQEQICNGFITIIGGHRIGITGNVVIEECKVKNINYISSLNFRIAKEIIGCSQKILKYILNVKNNTIYNTLIISPPGEGKTTILRDLLRTISTGIETINFKGLNVGLVDERGEIAAMYKGISQNDVGLRTDVLDNILKAIGMKMLIRSMGPQVISADEIGTIEDVETINYAMCSGTKGVFTAHGDSLEELFVNPILKNLLDKQIVERIILLKSKEVEKVYKLNKGEGYVIY